MKSLSIIAPAALIFVAQPIAAQGVYEGRIDGEYTGWEGETVYKLQDGHIIQQVSYLYRYHYAYSPKVIIYKTSRGLMMKVDGDSGEAVNIVVLK